MYLKQDFWSLSGIPDPDFILPRFKISNPGSRIQQEQQNWRGKKFLSYLFCCHKFYRIKNYFIFDQVQKEIVSKLWIPDSGVKKTPDPGSQFRYNVTNFRKKFCLPFLDPGNYVKKAGTTHCLYYLVVFFANLAKYNFYNQNSVYLTYRKQGKSRV